VIITVFSYDGMLESWNIGILGNKTKIFHFISLNSMLFI